MIMLNDALFCAPSKRKRNKYKVNSNDLCKGKAAKILEYKQIYVLCPAFETP